MNAFVPQHVFAFTGRLATTPDAEPVRGTAVARTPYDVIRAMRELGFHVQALSSLHDLLSLAEVLEATRVDVTRAAADGDLIITDRIQARLERGSSRLDAREVFTFTGHSLQSLGKVWSGFAAAAGAEDAIVHLGTFGFTVDASTSLAELHAEITRLKAVASGQGDQATVIDLFNSTAKAA